MKKTFLCFWSLMITFFGQAQIRLTGDAIPLSKINTNFSQQYLVLDPNSESIAYTEESPGSGDENVMVTSQVDGHKVYAFKDWLGSKGMFSPIGFYNGNLIYSHVVFDKSIYRGFVAQQHLLSGNKEKIEIPFMTNKSSVQSGCISANGRYLILSMESNNTYGVEDLYVAKKKADGSWSSFSNLGSDINTEHQEITPFLAADNETLFFATNGREGEGSYDIFYTVRQDDSWRNWSEPVNLGTKINTSGAETSFSFRDGADWAYFVSTQDSDGYGDIQKIKIEEEIEKDTSTMVEKSPVVAVSDSLERNKIILQVVNAETLAPISASLITNKGTIDRANGKFELDSLVGVSLEVKSAGFLSKQVTIDSTFQRGLNSMELRSVAVGNTIKLENILFKRSTAELVSGSEQELELMVELLNENPKMKILLKGHTDNTGNPTTNMKLSEARVNTVKAYILAKGIKANRVSGEGFGGSRPIASNESEETRKLNRRVEFEVIQN